MEDTECPQQQIGFPFDVAYKPMENTEYPQQQGGFPFGLTSTYSGSPFPSNQLFPSNQPRSPSPPDAGQILQEIEQVLQEIEQVAQNDPDPKILWQLQNIVRSARKPPTPAMTEADRQYVAKQWKLLDRQIEDRRIAEKEATARWLEDMHVNSSDTLFGPPRKTPRPPRGYCAAVAGEKAALQRKRLKEDSEEESRAKERAEAKWRARLRTQAPTLFGVPSLNKSPLLDDNAHARNNEKSAEQPKSPDEQIEDEAGAEETDPLSTSLANMTDFLFGRHPQARAPEGNADTEVQEDKHKGKGKDQHTSQIAMDTAPWESFLNGEGHNTTDFAGDRISTADVSAQSDAVATAADQVLGPVSPALSHTQSLTSSAGGTKSSVPESEPDVMPGGHIEKNARFGSPSTMSSTSSPEQEGDLQRAGKQLNGGLRAGA